jgi:hydroxymethylbilane synthase
MAKTRHVIIGTRGSKLALWQAEWVKTELIRLHKGLEVSLKIIKTTGDKILDVPLAKVGGKGLFVKEIEDSLLQGEADLAVHSMKDVPMYLPSGLHLSALCKREDPRDAFISVKYKNLAELPSRAVVGTSSLRRACQLLHFRSDLTISQLRGNVDTRLSKLKSGQFNAIVLAVAGVRRLGLGDMITDIPGPDVLLPAVGQGCIGIECRADDERTISLTARLNHEPTAICVRAERAFLRKLEGGCQIPIAAHGRIENDSLVLEGLVGSVDGLTVIREKITGSLQEDPEALGLRLAQLLINRGAERILALEMIDEN